MVKTSRRDSSSSCKSRSHQDATDVLVSDWVNECLLDGVDLCYAPRRVRDRVIGFVRVWGSFGMIKDVN